MNRLAVILVLGMILFMGLVVCNYAVSSGQIVLFDVTVKQDVFVMFAFGLAAFSGLIIYDMFAAVGMFQVKREQRKQIEKLESELLKPDSKSKDNP